MINSRLSTLRKYMSDYGIFAYIIPSSDPHLSEYVPDNWKRREWISGFDGSAGTVVVTNNEACLWTDSRYYLQAELQLSGSEFILFRDGESGVPDWLTWLAEKAPVNCRVGIDSLQFSYSEFANMSEKLSKKGISIASDLNFENALFSE
ncbi:MAG: aminopeptidase P family N-terminal domain-containing protein, partial [Paludibacteraceae bacterium]|nr:aminopeptidase P family N-terminal domain-containing protein [Paludibacteraceae bacterium]